MRFGQRRRPSESSAKWGAGLSARLVNLWATGTEGDFIQGDGTATGIKFGWQPVTDFGDWDMVTIGQTQSHGIRGGRLFSWGNNVDGRTGLGTSAAGNTLTPTQIGTDADWFAVEAGQSGSAALKGTGTLWTWGSNLNSQGARGAFGGSTISPTQAAATITDAVKLARGYGGFGAIIRSDGKLFTWGNNATFRTGQNTSAGNTVSPTEVPGSIPDWSEVSLGVNYGLGIAEADPYTGEGKLYSWGSNLNGRTGQGTGAGNTNVPTQVGSDDDWTLVAASKDAQHSLAVRDGGRLYGFGANGQGELGLNSTISPNVPTEVTEVVTGDVIAIKAGVQHSVVVANGGKLYGAGVRTQGAWGSPISTGNSNVFVQTSDQTDWVAVFGGPSTSFALKRKKA